MTINRDNQLITNMILNQFTVIPLILLGWCLLDSLTSRTSLKRYTDHMAVLNISEHPQTVLVASITLTLTIITIHTLGPKIGTMALLPYPVIAIGLPIVFDYFLPLLPYAFSHLLYVTILIASLIPWCTILPSINNKLKEPFTRGTINGKVQMITLTLIIFILLELVVYWKYSPITLVPTIIAAMLFAPFFTLICCFSDNVPRLAVTILTCETIIGIIPEITIQTVAGRTLTTYNILDLPVITLLAFYVIVLTGFVANRLAPRIFP